MYRLISIAVIIVLLGILHLSSGYRWKALFPYEPIPNKAVLLSSSRKTYVGRARHYDELLPAEIINATHALVLSCGKEFIKHDFEVLVATEYCQWKQFTNIEELPTNIVRAGNKWNGEPIYVAYSIITSQGARVASVLLTSREIITWPGANTVPYALLCEDKSKWVDTPSENIPSNAISGGISHNGTKTFVARLKKGCHIIPGQVIPELGIATAVNERSDLHSFYCQVLIGDTSKYNWISANAGEIPDYAVIAGRSVNSELMYVARVNKTLGYIVHSEALRNGMTYEILVKDPE